LLEELLYIFKNDKQFFIYVLAFGSGLIIAGFTIALAFRSFERIIAKSRFHRDASEIIKTKDMKVENIEKKIDAQQQLLGQLLVTLLNGKKKEKEKK